MTLTDDMLHSYLAGTAPEPLARAIETAVETDRDLEARLMALDPMAAPTKDVFEMLPNSDRFGALEEILTPAAPTNSAVFGQWWATAAACAVAAVALGWSLWPESPDWRMEVARYQALYVTETIEHLNSDPTLLSAQLQRAQDAIGAPLPQEALAGLDGLDLRRAQVLGFEGQELVQIVFSDAQGRPIALCLMQGDDGTLGGMELAGLASYSWGTGSHQFLLIGGDDQTTIDGLADDIMALGLGQT